ncbi:MAG: hypothetical protein ACRD1S_11285 [Vicinamibacterales bacterium]
MRTLAALAAPCILALELLEPLDQLLTAPQRNALASPTDPPSASVSADGRFVAFASYARLIPADTNESSDIYVLDRAAGRVTIESMRADHSISGAGSDHPRISGDGRYVVFELTVATSDDRTGRLLRRDVALRDRSTGTTRAVTVGATGEPPNGWSRSPAISADGRVVLFASHATNLVLGPDANGAGEDVYVFDVATGITRRTSVGGGDIQPPGGTSFAPGVSADGRYVTFASTAPLDGEPSSTRVLQTYVRDTRLGRTTRASVTTRSGLPNHSSFHPAISGDGRYVAFVSTATNLMPDDQNRAADVFLYDMQTGSTVLISRSAKGGSANGASGKPAISFDGRFIAFQSEASDLVCAGRCPAARADVNLVWDVYVFDRQTREMACVSMDPDETWMESSGAPALDSTGRVLAFSSLHPIDAADSGHDFDLFVRVNSAIGGGDGGKVHLVHRTSVHRGHPVHPAHPGYSVQPCLYSRFR